MNETSFDKLFREKVDKLRSDFDLDALEHLSDKGTKLSRLPDFPELSRLRGMHPDLMYQKAVQLRVDRNEVEEKILVPLRRALAALFQFQSAVTFGKSMIEDDDRPISEVEDDAGAEMLAQLMLLSTNLVKYDIDPSSVANIDDAVLN